MSINFATLQGLTIPEGVVTQIADASGRIIWAVSGSDTVILQVEKITSNTYAGETSYTGEQFILLNIYPKTNGTVNVTYGGLTKTITDTSGAAEPNLQKVFFGTFNGVSDSVATPASGELTIEGDVAGFSVGSYSKAKMDLVWYNGITGVISFGNIEEISMSAFGFCEKLSSVVIPNNIKAINSGAFSYCKGLVNVQIPASVTSLDDNPFYGCNINNPITISELNPIYKIDKNCIIEIATNKLSSGFLNSIIPTYIESIGGYAFAYFTELTAITIPSSVTSIGEYAFGGCTGLTAITIPSSVTSIGGYAFSNCTGLNSVTILSTTPPLTDTTPFLIDMKLPTYSIVVPKGCGEVYKAADGWSNYADLIVEVS